MRRKRSVTIEADSYEEFLKISIEAFSNPSPPRSDSLSSTSPTSPYGSPHRKDSLEGTSPGAFWDDIDYQASQSPELRSLSEADTTICSTKSRSDEDCYLPLAKEKEEMGNMSVRQIKVMVIGGKETGRHTLVNSLFDAEKKEKIKLENALDLVIKRQEMKDQAALLFKFWIKDANCHTFDQLIKVHYKTIKFYIFMYNTTDRKSFEYLDTAIEQAKAGAQDQKNFFGILVGNVRHQQSILGSLLGNKKGKREVTQQEGEELRKKHGLDKFFEVNLQSNQIKKEIMEFLVSSNK